MRQFFIVTNTDKDPKLETTHRIEAFLLKHGCKVSLLAREQNNDGIEEGQIDVPEGTECIIVLGGDGTLLRTARDTAQYDIPLFGINLGNLGFLTEVGVDGMEACLLQLIQDDLEIEERMMLDGTVLHQGQPVWNTHALNDIVVHRMGKMMVLSLEVIVNGMLLNRYLADGIMVATPTGSTGYSMSAGGPIVEPRAKLMVLTPICPHTLNTRSIILSAEDRVEIRIGLGRDGQNQQADVNFDGGKTYCLESGDVVSMGRSEQVIKLARTNRISFLETLHKKMSES